MHDINLLNRDLRQSEHETAQILYTRLTAEGVHTQKAVSLIYRAGIIDGAVLEKKRLGTEWDKLKKTRAEVYKLKYSNQNEPEQSDTTTTEEANNND